MIKELALIMSGTKKMASELTLSEMLNDPIVQLLMASDGVTKQDVELLVFRLSRIRITVDARSGVG